MKKVFLYNTLTRKIEKFKPLEPPKVRFYGCGPTVYARQHIGNYRTLLLYDFIVRSLNFLGYKVKFVMNYTDVGHLTMTELKKIETEKKLGKIEDTDTEEGIDKLEKQAKKEGLSAYQIAAKYIKACENDLRKLAFTFPTVSCRASDYIPQQIKFIKKLEKRGLTYKTKNALYFNVKKYIEKTGHNYFQLAGNRFNKQLVAVRNEVNEDKEKKDPVDFRLWQLNQPKHAMQWDSPWGKGFPGWHIECSTMATANLGKTIDIHAGGANLIFPHHTNEIAQSEGANNQKFVNYWIHGADLKVYGKKMGKSLGNAYTITDIEKQSIKPAALRYLYLQTHYRQPMNFTWESLQAAQEGLKKLKEIVNQLAKEKGKINKKQFNSYHNKFIKYVGYDFQFPQALALTWQMIKSKISAPTKYQLLLEFNKIFGLDFSQSKKIKIPPNIVKLAEKREFFRKVKRFDRADEIRKQIEKKGYLVKDDRQGYHLIKVD